MKKLEELNLKEAEVLDRSAFMSYSYNSGIGTSGSSGGNGSSGSETGSGESCSANCPDGRTVQISSCPGRCYSEENFGVTCFWTELGILRSSTKTCESSSGNNGSGSGGTYIRCPICKKSMFPGPCDCGNAYA